MSQHETYLSFRARMLSSRELVLSNQLTEVEARADFVNIFDELALRYSTDAIEEGFRNFNGDLRVVTILSWLCQAGPAGQFFALLYSLFVPEARMNRVDTLIEQLQALDEQYPDDDP